MSSTRLPGKVLLPLAGQPVVHHMVERVHRAQKIERVIIATTIEKEDDAIAELCAQSGYDYFRGSRDDVLSRYCAAAQQFNVDTVVRITCDNPLNDPGIMDEVVTAFQNSSCDYISNVVPGVSSNAKTQLFKIYSMRLDQTFAQIFVKIPIKSEATRCLYFGSGTSRTLNPTGKSESAGFT